MLPRADRFTENDFSRIVRVTAGDATRVES